MQDGLRPLSELVTIKPRLIICSQGLPKTGKSFFCFGAPQPVAFIDLDEGLDRAVNGIANLLGIPPVKYMQGVKMTAIQAHQEYVESRASKDPVVEISKNNMELLDRLRTAYVLALKSYRTVVVDGTQQLYELARLAYLGKLVQVNPREYGPVNWEMRFWIERAKQSDANVVFTNRLGDKWVKNEKTGHSEKTGETELRGWRDMAYEADMLVEHSLEDGLKVPDCFKATVLRCGMNTSVNGRWWSGADVDFATLGKAVFPDSLDSDWR